MSYLHSWFRTGRITFKGVPGADLRLFVWQCYLVISCSGREDGEIKFPKQGTRRLADEMTSTINGVLHTLDLVVVVVLSVISSC